MIICISTRKHSIKYQLVLSVNIQNLGKILIDYDIFEIHNELLILQFVVQPF